MRILISSLNEAAWVAEALATRPGVEVSCLQAARVDLGDFGVSASTPRPDAAYALHTLPVFPQRPYPYSLYRGDLGGVLRRVQPDVICHFGEPSELSTAQVVRAARRHWPQARLIVYSFENVMRRWSGFPRCLRGRAERYVLPRLDRVAACSHSAQMVLEQQGFPTERIRVVYQAVLDENTRPEPDPALRSCLGAEGRFLVGYVGRLVPEKGVDVLLRAIAQLPPEFVLCVVGDGRERAPLEALAAGLGIADRVRWLGRIDRNDVRRYMATLDALVLPSRGIPTWQEQFGAVLVEGMYCETAVVGSSSGAIPEIIGDTGLVFAEDNSADLAGCLRRLHDDPALRRRLAESGRERALREFTLSAYLQRLLALFDEALESDTGNVRRA